MHENINSVWIVMHDESPDGTVLGVFSTPEEAEDFADQVQSNFENGVLYAEFAIGYKYNDRPGHAEYEIGS